MSKRHPVDELFRRRLVRHETPVSDDLFSRIQKSRAAEPETKPTRPFWLFSTILALGLMATGYWLGYAQGQQKAPNQGYFPIAPVQSSTVVAANTATENTIVPNLTEEATDTEISTISSQDQVADNNLAQTSRIEEEIITAVANLGQESTVNNTQENNAIALAEVENENLEETALVDGDEIHPAEVKAIVADLEADLADKKMAAMSSLATCEISPLATTGLMPEWDRSPNNPRCAKFGSRKWHLDLDVLAGPSYGIQTFNDRTAENSDHLQKRISTETSVLSYGSMLRLSALAPNGIALRAGLAYSQLNTKFSYHNENELIIQVVVRTDPNGNIIGTDTLYQQGERELVKYNRFSMLELPLAVGYEFSCGRFKMAMNAGASLNLGFTARGVFLEPRTGQPTNFTNGPSDADNVSAYRSHLSASMDASFSIRYHIGGRYSLLAEPYVRHYTGSLTQSNYSLEHQATLIGLNMGLRMRLK